MSQNQNPNGGGQQSEAEKQAAAKVAQEAAEQKAREEAEAEAEKQAVAKADGVPKLKQGQLRIQKGRAVTTKRGIKAYPAGVRADDLSGGADALKALRDKKILGK